jgi:hypothetical protein
MLKCGCQVRSDLHRAVEGTSSSPSGALVRDHPFILNGQEFPAEKCMPGIASAVSPGKSVFYCTRPACGRSIFRFDNGEMSCANSDIRVFRPGHAFQVLRAPVRN